MKTIVKYVIIALIVFVLACSNDDDTQNSQPVIPTMANIIDPIHDGVIMGTSSLTRNQSSIQVAFETSGLIAGHAYTLWWVIWNKPENCSGYPEPCLDTDFAIASEVEVEFLYADGLVATTNGTTMFFATLNKNDDAASINASVFDFPEFGGLQNAQTAEVHFILRSHGPVVDSIVNQQISTFGGGCNVNLPPFTEIPDEVGECSEIQFAIHQAQ